MILSGKADYVDDGDDDDHDRVRLKFLSVGGRG
jgi:hypothetical protein